VRECENFFRVVVLKKLLFLVLFAVAVAGCLDGSSTPTATPQASATVQASPLSSPLPSPEATATPSPTVVIDVPSPSPEATNYSKEELVSAYLKAVDSRNFEKAYSLVSRDFKEEDPDARTLAKFKSRMEKDYAYGLNFTGVEVAKENDREVLVKITKGGSTVQQKYGFIVVFESGFWKLRIPYPTPGLYYNANVSFLMRSSEIARLLELAANDYFSTLDSKFKSEPIELDLFDKANFVYYASGIARLKRSDGLMRDSKFELTFGPSYTVGGLSNFADLLPDRKLYFEYQDGIKAQGGHGGFFCYYNTTKLILKVKLDLNFADMFSYEDNIFKPVVSGLNKICPT